ncbi:MCE family protein [Spongiactinospora sp. TRM90649]|uniref:MCE family protein n=1 Tax=Spongiactinospora sp. TRM90649 TaxID=3031114 RepID=UPI0023F80D83|nr:MCE family protein [Spongiactinospora sp. TRM90649]MDF5755907.1 MCE family protein [Spongiactinospora sp. TRM90649]
MRARGAVVVAAVLALGGCALPPGGSGPPAYRLTAYFAATPALYEQAKVKVLGLDAGSVERIRAEGDRVRVDMTIRGEVPLPADVRAVVTPRSILGEREVALHPPWRPGRAAVAPGAVIPLERTALPVEIDEALEAFTRLAEALDARRVSGAGDAVAEAVAGRGEALNRALGGAARLARTLAGQDERLVELAGSLHRIASRVNRREREVTEVIDAVAETAATLADERARLRRFVSGLSRLVRSGDVLIESYRERLPRGVTALAELVLTLRANSASAAAAVEGAGRFAGNVIDSWDRDDHLIRVRIPLGPLTRAWLTPLFETLGLGEVPCLPGGPGGCRWERSR